MDASGRFFQFPELLKAAATLPFGLLGGKLNLPQVDHLKSVSPSFGAHSFLTVINFRIGLFHPFVKTPNSRWSLSVI